MSDSPFSDSDVCEQPVVVLPTRDGFIEIDSARHGSEKYTPRQFGAIDKLDRNTVYIIEGGGIRPYSRIENSILTLFLTSACNEKCIMCPQEVNKPSLDNARIAMLVSRNISYDNIEAVYVTGGEPLLESSALVEIIRSIPANVEVDILTNLSTALDKAIDDVIPRVRFCIPLYGSMNDIHDAMVGVDGFYRTLLNMYHLAEQRACIELRNVITRYNYKNLPEYSYYIYNNLPFVSHVAFMGMELVESAAVNEAALWVDPDEYMPYLCEAVSYLDDVGIGTFIYNIPLCLVPEKHRSKSAKAISPWKRRYLECCKGCLLQESCGGLFTSTVVKYSLLIKPQVS